MAEAKPEEVDELVRSLAKEAAVEPQERREVKIEDGGGVSILGDTRLVVGDFAAATPPAVWDGVDAVLNCGGEEHSEMRGHPRYLFLPAADEKKHDPTKQWWSEVLLPRALRFLWRHLEEERRVLIHCTRGDNRSPAVAAAALAAFFGDAGQGPRRVSGQRLEKSDQRRCLVTVQCYHPHCRVPRRLMQFLNLFFVSEGGGWSSWEPGEDPPLDAQVCPNRPVTRHKPRECRAEEVQPGLWISGLDIAKSLPLLRQLKITHIVNVTNVSNFFEDEFLYHQIPIEDSRSENLLDFLDPGLAFIHGALTPSIGQHVRVLVHCREGASRSVAVVAAYLIRFEGFTLDSALQRLRDLRATFSLASWADSGSKNSLDSQTSNSRALEDSEEEYVGSLAGDPDTDPFMEAFNYFKEQQRSQTRKIADGTGIEETRFGCLLSAEEIDQLLEEDIIRRKIQSTILMDIFFGMVIVANGVMMGLTTQGVVDEMSQEAQIFEIAAWMAWSDFFLRVILTAATGGATSDESSAFDAGTSSFAVLRVARLMRLLRLVRLLRDSALVQVCEHRILQQLWLLLSSMVASMRALGVLFWAIAMLSSICDLDGLGREMRHGSTGRRVDTAGYIFGILMFTLNGEDILTNDWGGVAQSMFSLAQIATYNGMELVRRRTEHTARTVGSDAYLFMPVLFIFMGITSMGIMNLIVGVLLTAVLERGNQENSLSRRFLRFQITYANLCDKELTQMMDEMFEQTIMKLRQHRALRRLRFGLVLHAKATLGNVSKDQTGGSQLVTRRMLQGWASGPDPWRDKTPDVEMKHDTVLVEEEDEEKDTIQEQIQEIQTGNTNLDALRGLLNRASRSSADAFGATVATTAARQQQYLAPGEKEDLRLILPRLFNDAGMIHMHSEFNAVTSQLDECRDFMSPLLQWLGLEIWMFG
ncbi:Dual specificity protein phosphatase 9 (Mitogen-activated protein kinase phosphatase 4) (MAP kinase phosphatase 4) (MKP-4) [Durusdinium trenchii]|uniref:Dual specificity protein phosphatase 9 (Mitogen-activated protein kinase phosphatase 4) (MAP kinase phosphatase 4) (MKP-4) n=1 Tax=Durusdinium trenchii TaxID=1381693 RepID=A0ABP0RPA7_9DINO